MRQLSSKKSDLPCKNAGANDLSDFTGLISKRVKTCTAGCEIYILLKGFSAYDTLENALTWMWKTNKQTIKQEQMNLLTFWSISKCPCWVQVIWRGGGLLIKNKSKACYNSHNLLKLLKQPQQFEFISQWWQLKEYSWCETAEIQSLRELMQHKHLIMGGVLWQGLNLYPSCGNYWMFEGGNCVQGWTSDVG